MIVIFEMIFKWFDNFDVVFINVFSFDKRKNIIKITQKEMYKLCKKCGSLWGYGKMMDFSLKNNQRYTMGYLVV